MNSQGAPFIGRFSIFHLPSSISLGRVLRKSDPLRGALISILATTAVSLSSAASAQDLLPGRVRLRAEEVDAAAGRRLGRVKSCYGEALARAPRLFGVVSVGMAVDKDGGVSDRWIQLSTVGDPTLEECILKSFEKIVFPPPGEPGAVVRYGLLLSTDETPATAVAAQEEAFRRGARPPSASPAGPAPAIAPTAAD